MTQKAKKWNIHAHYKVWNSNTYRDITDSFPFIQRNPLYIEEEKEGENLRVETVFSFHWNPHRDPKEFILFPKGINNSDCKFRDMVVESYEAILTVYDPKRKTSTSHFLPLKFDLGKTMRYPILVHVSFPEKLLYTTTTKEHDDYIVILDFLAVFSKTNGACNSK